MNRIKTAGVGIAAIVALSFTAISYAAYEFYFTEKGQKVQGEMRGNQFILIGLRGNPERAPDGTYKTLGGEIIVVKGGLIVQGGKTIPGASKMLNPQPLPPGPQSNNGKPMNPGEAKGFNPQPDPPGDTKSNKFMNPGATHGFNPQPEPPGDKTKGAIIGPEKTNQVGK